MQHVMDVLNQAYAIFNHAKELREQGVAMRKARANAVVAAGKGCLDNLHAKDRQWRELITELNEAVRVTKAEIVQIESLIMNVKSRVPRLQQCLYVAESRLATRNSRPTQERKIDSAENALVGEVSQLSGLEREMYDKAMSLHGEKVEVEERLAGLLEHLTDAESARAVDAACLEMQQQSATVRANVSKVGIQLTPAYLAHDQEQTGPCMDSPGFGSPTSPASGDFSATRFVSGHDFTNPSVKIVSPSHGGDSKRFVAGKPPVSGFPNSGRQIYWQ